MRDEWTVQIGDHETLEKEREEYWKAMTPQERLDAMMELCEAWGGQDERRLERTYRIVTIPPR